MNYDLLLIAVVILSVVGSLALKPMYHKFRANRAKERKKPENYRLT